MEVREAGCPGAGVIDCCELPDVDARKRTGSSVRAVQSYPLRNTGFQL